MSDRSDMEVDHVLAVARSRVRAEAEAVAAVAEALGDDFVRAASLVSRCRGKVFIGGSGTSGVVARRMAHILSVTGTPSVFLSPMDSLHGGAGAIGRDDIVLVISKGGASDEVLDCVRLMRRRGVHTIGLSRSHDTALGRLVDLSIALDVPDEAELAGVVATGITLAQAAWGDALAEVLMRARGYTMQEFLETHPAGAVGRIEDLPDDLPRLTLPDADWADAAVRHA